jgi:hypothetical protein
MLLLTLRYNIAVLFSVSATFGRSTVVPGADLVTFAAAASDDVSVVIDDTVEAGALRETLINDRRCSTSR